MSTLTTYEPLDPRVLADPYPVLAALRSAAPVSWHEAMQSWVVTRYEDCVRVLRDHHRFARDRRRLGVQLPESSLSVQTLDPPAQAPVRSLFMTALHAQDLNVLEDRSNIWLRERLDVLSTRPAFDAMADLAVPLSLLMITDLLGVAPPDARSFTAVSDTITRSMDAGLDPSTVEPGRQAREALTALVNDWFHEASRPGLLSHVRAQAEPAPGSVLDLYIRNTARVLFQGGYSTMVAAIGNSVHALLAHPDALSAMRHPALLRSGVEELVRFDGPVQGTSRIAMEPVTLGEVTVRRGEVVLTHFAAANRDPDQFTSPDELRVDRAEGRHLGYGWGAHACLGASAAQMALRVLVRGLLDRPTPLRPAGMATRRRTATLRSFALLPVGL